MAREDIGRVREDVGVHSRLLGTRAGQTITTPSPDIDIEQRVYHPGRCRHRVEDDIDVMVAIGRVRVVSVWEEMRQMGGQTSVSCIAF